MTDWEHKTDTLYDIYITKTYYILAEVFNHQIFFTKLCPVFGAYSVVCFKAVI